MQLLKRFVRFVLILLGAYVAAQFAIRLLRRLFPFPVPPIMSPLLDAPVRELSQPRQGTLQRIGLQQGMRALEVGAGPGYFTVQAAQLLGPEGHLTSIDVQPQMVAQVLEKVQREGLQNVDAQVADAKSLPFPDGSFDLAFLVAVMGSFTDRGRALRELRRVLKPDGRLSITEAVADPDFQLMPAVVRWAQMVGFELVEQHGNALQYTLNFRSIIGP